MTYSLLRVVFLCGCNSISCNLMAMGPTFTILGRPGWTCSLPATTWQLPMNRRRWLALSLHPWDQGWKQGADLEDFVEISVFAEIMWSQKDPKGTLFGRSQKTWITLFPQLVKYSNLTRCNQIEFPVAMAEEACQGRHPQGCGSDSNYARLFWEPSLFPMVFPTRI